MDLEEIINTLEHTRVSSSGVSFAGKTLKLNTAADAKPIVEAIQNCKELVFLNLEGNTLGVDAAREIAKALEKHPEFKQALWKDMFTGRLKTEIPKALEFLGQGLVISESRLTELDLSDNAFGPIGVKGLAALLRSPSCYCLEILRLNNNGLGIEGGKLLSKALIDCHSSSKQFGKALCLKVFIAGRNRLENNGAIALAEMFKTIGTLEEIGMPQNSIYHVGMKALSEAFKKNKNLKIINLNDNTVGATGAQHLSLALQELQHLKILNFGDCLLKTKGVKCLAAGLKDNTSMEELILSFNEIKLDGVLELTNVLQNKVKLKSLILDGNQFGSNGREQLKSKLKQIGKLQCLGSLDEDESEDEEDSDASEMSNEQEDDDDNEDEETEDEDEDIDPPIETENIVNGAKLDDFLKAPDTDKFIALGNNRTSMLLNEIKKCQNNIEEYIVYIMKIASLSENKKVFDEVIACCELLFKELFNYGHKADKMSIINNSLLVNLGLIKCEDKKYKPTWNIDACFLVLKSFVTRNYFPDSTRDTLKLFLQKCDNNGSNARKELISTLS